MSEEMVIERIDGLKLLTEERFNENREDHSKIWIQVNKTNGRVRLLEKFIWGLSGAIAILGFMSSVLLFPIIIKFIFR